MATECSFGENCIVLFANDGNVSVAFSEDIVSCVTRTVEPMKGKKMYGATFSKEEFKTLIELFQREEEVKKGTESLERVMREHGIEEPVFKRDRETGDWLCPECGKRMEMQYDSKLKKKSPYLWRCEKCMPEGIVLSIG